MHMTNQSPQATNLTVVEDPDLVPQCPHCDTFLTSVRARQLSPTGTPASRFGKRYIYACPSCNKTLGVSHRKGFWMG